MSVFAVTTLANAVKAEKGSATIVFNVTNATNRPLAGIAKIAALDSTESSWLKIDGEAERNFPAGQTQQVTVAFNKPLSPALIAQSFPFRLDMISAANPSEDYTEGPRVTVEVEGQIVDTGGPKWLIIGILVALLLIGGGVGYLLLRPRPEPVGSPDNATPSPTEISNNAAPSPEAQSAKQVVIYVDANFKGASQMLKPGERYDNADGTLIIGNDKLSSLKVSDGLIARLYGPSWFQGEYLDVSADTPALPPSWNDQTSSIIVFKAGDPAPRIDQVVIFEHSEYNKSNNWIGAYQVLKKGKYNVYQLTIGDNSLSSAYVPDGMVLRIYENDAFQGAYIELRNDTPAISLDWNDRGSSIIVYGDGESVP